jgi:hypothetical protein
MVVDATTPERARVLHALRVAVFIWRWVLLPWRWSPTAPSRSLGRRQRARTPAQFRPVGAISRSAWAPVAEWHASARRERGGARRGDASRAIASARSIADRGACTIAAGAFVPPPPCGGCLPRAGRCDAGVACVPGRAGSRHTRSSDDAHSKAGAVRLTDAVAGWALARAAHAVDHAARAQIVARCRLCARWRCCYRVRRDTNAARSFITRCRLIGARSVSVATAPVRIARRVAR